MLQIKIEALESNKHGFNFALPFRSCVTLNKLVNLSEPVSSPVIKANSD